MLPSSMPSMLQLSYSSALRSEPLPSKSPETNQSEGVSRPGHSRSTFLFTDGQAHQEQVHVFHFGQLLYDRTEKHALVVRMCGDQQHPVRRVLQLDHLLPARGPQTRPHVPDNEHRRRHKHGRAQVDHFENVLMEYLVRHTCKLILCGRRSRAVKIELDAVTTYTSPDG